jgi:hypothetical protein
MFDLNQILSAALNAAVQQAIKPLVERIAALEEGCVGIDQRLLEQRVALLETTLTEAKLFEQTTNVTIPIDEAKMVEALNSQEWFWEKINAYIETGIEDRIERAIDDHCSNYNHDDYDSVVSNWNDEDPADFLREGDLHDQIDDRVNETLRNATFSISI